MLETSKRLSSVAMPYRKLEGQLLATWMILKSRQLHLERVSSSARSSRVIES